MNEKPLPLDPTLGLVRISSMTEMYQIHRRISGAYVVDKHAVEKLANAIEEAVGKPPKLTIEFANKRKVTSETTLGINDSYVGIERIDSISLSAYSDGKGCSLELGWTHNAPIYFDIKLPHLEAKNLETNIENMMTSYKSWYHGIFKLKQTSVTFTTIIGLLSVIAVIMTITLTNWIDSIINNRYVIISYKSLVVITLVNAIFDLTLPSMSFDIGLSGKNFRRNKAIFSFLIFVVIAGVAINILSDLIKPHFMNLIGI